MKTSALLLLLCVCVYGVPLDQPKPGSCKDASTLGAAKLALTKINQDRKEGYVFSLYRLCNVNQMQHDLMGMVYYLTMDVLETKCHILSKKPWESCEVRNSQPVYGQCHAIIYINKVKRIIRLYHYSCTVRPAPPSKIVHICPDCPSSVPLNDENALKTVKQSLVEFNKKSGLANYFTLLNITKASIQRGIATFDFVEFTIQETVCANNSDIAEAANCKLMDCEFAHKGFCKGSMSVTENEEHLDVNCDIFEPKDAEKEKSRHLVGGEHEHSHSHEHGAGHSHSHEHSHDHKHHKNDHKQGAHHDHKHDHHKHGHGHNHDNASDHDHHHHHGPESNHTDEHSHYDHKHLHAYEQHHHHHDQAPKTTAKEALGIVHYIPSLDKAIPSLPDKPDASHHPVTLPVFPDTHAHGPQEKEPTILPFPSTLSPECPGNPINENTFIDDLFKEDPLFQHKAH